MGKGDAQGFGQLGRRGRAVTGGSERCGISQEIGIVQIDVEVAAVEDLVLVSLMAMKVESLWIRAMAGSRYRTAVASSWAVTKKPPSPLSETICEPAKATAAPAAAGKTQPNAM